jgi:autotransporter family porin
MRARSGVLAALAGALALTFAAACAPPKPPGVPQKPPTTPPRTGGTAHFGTLPPKSALPSDQTCASRVRKAAEVRPGNAVFNNTVGHLTAPAPPYGVLYGRVTGNFKGTTDEIIQWIACKWGIDEDVVRAQVALESWWRQTTVGDFSSDATACAPGHPIGADGQPGQCPQSIGLIQDRTPYMRPYINDAAASSAYNLDIGYAIWRSCFEGAETWLNTVDRGRQYAAGDMWGCIGRWFSGRWYTSAATGYMARVQDYLNQRIWTTPNFVHG